MPKPFSVSKFLEFCRSKPAGEAYNPFAARHCALAQFGYPDVGSFNLGETGVPEAVYEAATFDAIAGGRTFGQLADRLAKLEPQP